MYTKPLLRHRLCIHKYVMGNFKNDMRCRLTFGLLIFLLCACSKREPETYSKSARDLVIGSKIIKDELAGSSYRKRAIGYFAVTNKDTSDFICIFTESKVGGKVGIDLNIPYLKNTVTHAQRFNELKWILERASEDFNFDSLSYISFGRLVQSGDLAIAVTKEYKQKNPSFKNLFVNYTAFEEFLVTSKLGRDLNEIFKPYSISITSSSVEKLFLTTKKDLYWASKVETDSTMVPEKVLDAIVMARLKKNNP